MYQSIQQLIASSLTHFDTISETRKKELDTLAQWMQSQLNEYQQLACIVICTHNSRRSHLGQLLLALAADYYNIKGLSVFSGGTEATAFNSRMVSALIREGFNIQNNAPSSNPIYTIKWGDGLSEQLSNVFSKVYDDKSNPQSKFLAIMVCDSAAQNCPLVLGAAKRVSITYKDPKDFDDTTYEGEAYSSKIHEMGKEFFYLIHRITAL